MEQVVSSPGTGALRPSFPTRSGHYEPSELGDVDSSGQTVVGWTVVSLTTRSGLTRF